MRNLLPALLLASLLAAPVGAAGPTEWPTPTAEVGPALVAEDGVHPDMPEPRLTLGTEYILWWLREGRLPATLTTSSQASQGFLGRPDTRVLYGDDRLPTRHGDRFNGIDVTLAYWFDDTQSLGIEGNAFFLERDSTHFKAVSDGSVLLARPFTNPDGSPASEVIAGQAPAGPRDGGFVGYSRIELFGETAHLVAPLGAGDAWRVEGLAGARFLQMRDRTDLTASGHALPGHDMLFGLEDHYRVENAYYGGEVGLRGEVTRGRWSLRLRGDVGLGADVVEVRAFGQRIAQTAAVRIATPAGLTVQASNSGTFDRSAVNLVSEVGLQVGCRLTRRVRVFGGYTFLLWDSPLRSGDQVDPVVNTSPGTAPARPAIPFKEDLFWAQGLDAGLELDW